MKGDLAMQIPDAISFEAAATVDCGVLSAGYGLYNVLKLPLPSLDGHTVTSGCEPIFIYGGSTATGTLAIQFAKL